MSKQVIAFFIFALVFLGFSGLNASPVHTVFAEDHGDNQDSSSKESGGDNQGGQINGEQNHTRSDNQNESENKTMSENYDENKTMSENESENKTMSENYDENKTTSEHDDDKNKTESEGMMRGEYEGEDSQQEMDHQKNNERITHHVTDKERSHIEEAKTHRAIAAEIEIDNGNVDHKSIDNNIIVQTANSSANSVNITVSATNQTGPKVILVNLNSTTIDVSSMKYLHVLYDGKVITPADSVDQVLNVTSSDDPHYSILITSNGAQVLISIPHFSTHTITLDSLSKVIPAIPEFGQISVLVLVISIMAVMLVSTKSKIRMM